MKISEDLLQLIAAAGRGEVIEYKFNTIWHDVTSFDELLSCFRSGVLISIKPKMRTLAGVEFPEPLLVAPEIGTEIWVVDPASSHKALRNVWHGEDFKKEWLRSGLMQLTEKGAKDQAKAMILSVGGSLE